MKVIGITGGIGSGKSKVIGSMRKKYRVYLISTDEVAMNLMRKGNVSYQKVVGYFGTQVLGEDGEINRSELAKLVFEKEEELLKLNSFTHKDVREEVLRQIERVKNRASEENQIDGYDYILVETALPYEARLNEYCDEIWYVYASLEIRQRRLVENRGYSTQKVNNILNKQLPEEAYRDYCEKILVNDTNEEDILKQIETFLK